MASARPAHSDQITADRSPTPQNTDTVQQRDDSRKDDPDPGLSPSTSSADLPYNKRDAGFVYRQTWKGKIWDTLDLPPFERRMLLKVDSVLLTLMAAGYFLKNLDQHNVSAAFFSGMRDDLGMHRNELVTATTCWTVGYVLGQIPINLLLTRVSPRWVIPTLILIWGIATLGNYAITNVTHLYVCRFLVGLFESGFYSAAHMILGSWYTPRELGKRSMIFWVSGFIGQMFAGYLQSAAYTNLSGVRGLEGWRWMFIVDAIITIPIAIAGYFFYPDMPLTGKCPWWLKQDEFELACARAGNHGKVGKEPWSRAKLKRLASSWHFWMLPMLYVLWNNGNIQSPFQYWMESFNKAPYPIPDRRFSVPQINNLPTVGTAFQIVAALSGAWISDGPFKGKRWPLVLFDAIASIIFAIAHLATPLYQNVIGRIGFFWLMDISVISGPLILAWSNEICANDLEKRALIVAMGNDFAFVFRAIVPNFVWQTINFPAARIGFIYSISLNVALVFWTFACMWMRRRELRIEAARRDSLDSSAEGVVGGEISDIDSKAEHPVEAEEPGARVAASLPAVELQEKARG